MHNSLNNTKIGRNSRPPRLIEDREKSMEENEQLLKKYQEEGNTKAYKKVRDK
jgi:hypothetical protein